MKCYKLVFNLNYLKKNAGNFIVFAFFLIYLFFFIIYIIKGISPLTEEIMKNLNTNKTENSNIKENSVTIKENNNKINNINNIKDINYPPKKKKSVLITSNNNDKIIALNNQRKKNRKSNLNVNKMKIDFKLGSSAIENKQLLKKETIR